MSLTPLSRQGLLEEVMDKSSILIVIKIWIIWVCSKAEMRKKNVYFGLHDSIFAEVKI
jgi:hypothetical protein